MRGETFEVKDKDDSNYVVQDEERRGRREEEVGGRT